VPDVGSATAQAAVQKLNAAGLLVTLAYVPGNGPLGTVVAQSPNAGGSAQTGSHVTLNLSAGSSASGTVQVPSVTGQTIPQAVSAMKQAGVRLFFVRKAVTDASQAGKVVEQTPAAGTSVPKNAKVLVYMGAVR
jgi:serine/threonine-protein kinase